MKNNQIINIKKIAFMFILLLSFLICFGSKYVYAEELENDVQVLPESELIYYIEVSYDGVDINKLQSSDSQTCDIRSDIIEVEDKIPEGLIFTGFVTTDDGTIGATERDSNSPLDGEVIDDTNEASVDSGTWNDSNTEYYYHGLHYTKSDNTVRFKVKNLTAGGVLRVGVITQTPTVDDPNTPEVETRRDFYNTASALENVFRAISNTVHVFMGNENETLYNVTYQYTGALPDNVPGLPDVTKYTEGSSVGVATKPEIDGYTFSGWTTLDATIQDGTFTMPAGDVVLTGSFTEDPKYTVTYNIDGTKPEGYIVPLEKTYYEGANVKVDSLKVGDRFGNYIFSGWNSNDVNITEDDEDNEVFTMPNSDVVLTGSFTPVTYTVEYRFYDTVLPPNSDNYLPSSASYVPGATVTTASKESVNNPDGYEFLGWYKEDTFEMPEENVVIYGEWRQITGEFEVEIEKEVVDEQVAYRVGDVVDFKITVTNPNNFALTDVFVKENYTKVNDGTQKDENIKANFVDGEGYSKEANDIVLIPTLAANGSVTIGATYTVTSDDEREGSVATVINEVEIIGALEQVNHYTLKDSDYTAQADFDVVTQYRISGEVKKHEESRTNTQTNAKETTEVFGGTISNNYNNVVAEEDNIAFFEYVDGNASTNIETLTITPDSNEIVKKVSLVSSNRDGSGQETKVIYGENADSNAELTYTLNNNGTVTIKPNEQTKLFRNVTKDKHIIAEFEGKKGKVTVHHMINPTEQGNDPTEHSIVEKEDLVGEPYTTEAITLTNYKLVDTSNNTTGNYLAGSYENGLYTENNIDVYYYYDVDETQVGDLNYTVHYFYNGVEDETKKATLQAGYRAQITSFPDKSNGYTFIEAKALSEAGTMKDAPLTSNPLIVGMDETKNQIYVYYKTAYTIKGTVKNNKGGTAKNGAGDAALETVLYGADSTEKIVMTPNDGYEAVSLVIYTESTDTTETLDIDSFSNSNGVITIPVGYFENVTTNKEVIVEFKKHTSVIVKYLEKGTETVKATQVTIDGLEGDSYTPTAATVNGYRLAQVVTNDGSKSNVTFANNDKFDLTADNKMGEDTITVIFWYEPIPKGTLVVKHIEVDELDIEEGLTLTSGTVISEESFEGVNGDTKATSRKEFTDSETGRNYVSEDGPTSSNGVVVLGKDDNSYTVTFTENANGVIDAQEVRYYYGRTYKILTSVKAQDESKKGGTISGEGQDPYESVKRNGTSTKEIVITPKEGYRVKDVKVNGNIISIARLTAFSVTEDTNRVVTISVGYFENVTEDKNVEAEFEKIPAKVIARFLLDGELIEITDSETTLGLVGDEYNIRPKEIPGYKLVEVKKPTNNKGNMTEDDIFVTYYYEKIIEETIEENGGEKEDTKKEETKTEDNKTEEKNETSDTTTDEVEEQVEQTKASSKQYKNPVTGDKIVTYTIIFIVAMFGYSKCKKARMIKRKRGKHF